MKICNRRQFLNQGLGLATAVIPFSLEAKSLDFLADQDDTNIGLNNAQRFKLSKAVLDVLQSHYAGMKLQFWNDKFENIDFEKRITNIVYWVDKATRETPSKYAVDPIWVISQIMAESLFCELAVSNSMAVGICQFMPSTAKSHKMIIAGSLPEHHHAPYLNTPFANALTHYQEHLKEKTAYRKSSAADESFNLNKALKTLATGGNAQPAAQKQLQRQAKLAEFDQQLRQIKKDYLIYLRSNVEKLGGNDIFKNTDFFTGFDERFTYKKPIYAMVAMLANALRVRSGNILTAAAAYNAGLSRTWTDEALYTRYGTLPNFNETSQYLSRIVANYEEIALRYTA